MSDMERLKYMERNSQTDQTGSDIQREAYKYKGDSRWLIIIRGL